jgi:hypothetical protein
MRPIEERATPIGTLSFAFVQANSGPNKEHLETMICT